MENENSQNRPEFKGQLGALFELYLTNFLLTLCTLGVYSFWGKTNIRKYIWGNCQFGSDRFSYHGTGDELIRGFVKAILIFFAANVLFIILKTVLLRALGHTKLLDVVFGIFQYAMLFGFFALAMIGTWRYRLSRTSWRGIRFAFTGKTIDYVSLVVSNFFLQVFTLGFYLPFGTVRAAEFRISHTYFGSQRFELRANGGDLFLSFVIAVLLTPFTLGLVWFWYVAELKRYLWSRTRVGKLRFSMNVTGGDLLFLGLTNLLIVVFTMGLGFPVAIKRKIDFFSQRIVVKGSLDDLIVYQTPQTDSALGEALGEFLQVDFDIGLGIG